MAEQNPNQTQNQNHNQNQGGQKPGFDKSQDDRNKQNEGGNKADQNRTGQFGTGKGNESQTGTERKDGREQNGQHDDKAGRNPSGGGAGSAGTQNR